MPDCAGGVLPSRTDEHQQGGKRKGKGKKKKSQLDKITLRKTFVSTTLFDGLRNALKQIKREEKGGNRGKKKKKKEDSDLSLVSASEPV